MDVRQLAIAVIIVIGVAVLAVLLGYRWGRRASDRVWDDAAGGARHDAARPDAGMNGNPAKAANDAGGFTRQQSVFGRGTVRQAEEQFIKIMPDMLVIADGEGHIRYVSPAANALGVVKDGQFASDDMTQVVSMVAADGQTRDREITMESRQLLGEGDRPGRGIKAGTASPTHTRHVLIHAGPIDEHRVAVFIRDISERRRFEMMRRDFVTNVSHELKTPAGAISLLAETITDAADDPDAVRYFSQRISKESERLTNLVQRLIELQRAESTAGIAAARRVDALDVVEDAAKQNEVQAEHKHIEIRVTHTGGQAWIMVDPRALTTAVKNLIENAIHYSPEGTTVTADIARHDAEATVTVRVIDQGIGIPEQSLDRIFERFYRVDPARSRDTGGTGLGLAITKHCVEECGGTISAWSHEGSGSTFTIELPLAASDDDGGERNGNSDGGIGAHDDANGTHAEATTDTAADEGTTPSSQASPASRASQE